MSEDFDPVAFVAKTVQPLAEFTFPFVCSIMGVEDADFGQHVGTAFRVSYGLRRFLVTARHVVDQANSYPMGAAFVLNRGKQPISLSGVTWDRDELADIAVTELDVGTDVAACIPTPEFDSDRKARAHDYLFLHGFPGAKARFLFKQSHHRSLPYGVMERDDALPSGMESFEFAVDYDPQNMRIESGALVDLVHPAGLSGSPIWRIGVYRRKPEEWIPHHARLVGVATKWDQSKRVLIASGVARLEALIELIARR